MCKYTYRYINVLNTHRDTDTCTSINIIHESKYTNIPLQVASKYRHTYV